MPTPPAAAAMATGDVGETVEGRLVRLDGTLVSGGSALASGTAFDLDDGSGAARVVVPAGSGIDLARWVRGAQVSLVGVVGQRDSTGSGTEGYRVMPRDAGDVLSVGEPASSAPSATPSAPASPSPSASELPEGVSTVAEARAAAKNTRLRIRGVVTLPTGVVDTETAVLQDGTGAIVLRLGEEAGSLQLGDHVEVAGMRSTKSGMETVRVSEPPLQLGTAPQPGPRAVRTGDAGEAHEATLIVARGALVAAARRAASGAVSFEIDDGSGALRVSLGAALEADDEELVAGTWVEVRGVLGQETSGAQPLRGYRIWPRSASEVTITGPLAESAAVAAQRRADSSAGDGEARGGMAGAGRADGTGATLVVGPWPELGLGGVLWDGSAVRAIDGASAAVVTALLGAARAPVPVNLVASAPAGSEPTTGVGVVSLSAGTAAIAVASGPVSPPLGEMPSERTPAWVSLVGRLHDRRLHAGTATVEVDYRCDAPDHPSGIVVVVGIATAETGRVVVPCDGIRRAPAVARAAGDEDPHTLPAAEPAVATAPTGDHRKRILAGVLVAAAVGLLAASLVARRLRPRGPEDETGGPAVSEEPAVDAAAPRLALVRLPNEHGS